MIAEYASVAAVPVGVWRWSHVDPAREWACKGTGRILVDTDFLDLFEALRARAGRPLIITSGYRTPVHNASVSSTGLTGPHTTGRAVDIRIYGHRLYELVADALELGMTGVGFSQKSSTPHAQRFVHLDNLPNGATAPRPWMWSY